MKHFYSGMLVTLALVLAIVMGVVALAENAETETPAIEEAPAVTEPTGGAEAPADATESTALQDALNAYNQARQSSKVENLEAELNGYVASGKLTQEQADLILNYYKEQESLRNGVCPNCGYQFQNNGGFGKGGRMNGGKGGRGGHGGKGGFGMLPNNTQDNAQADGMALEGFQMMPNDTGVEGI